MSLGGGMEASGFPSPRNESRSWLSLWARVPRPRLGGCSWSWTGVHRGLLWAVFLGLSACGGGGEAPPSADGEASSEVHRSGAAIYQRYCFSCHAAGVAGAPKAGDAGAWTSRLAKGQDALLRSTIDGMVGMPAMGLCFDCSERELAGAIDYMSGAATEPTP